MAMVLCLTRFQCRIHFRHSLVPDNLNAAARLLLSSRNNAAFPFKSVSRFKCGAGKDNTTKEVQEKQQEEDKLSKLWSLLRLQGWDVPWDYGVTSVGLLGWLLSYLMSGLAVAVLAQTSGVDRLGMLDLDEQALFILFNQVIQTAAGLTTINLIVRKYEPLPSDWFVYDLKKPFDLQRGWLLWSGVGVLGAAGAVFLSGMITSYFNNGELPPREGTDSLSLLLPLIGASPLSTGSLIIVTGGLAPLLEETVFRGFLLTSLTKRLPVPVAVLLSSAAFALAHLTPREFPQLFALGVVIGFAYAKTHNMLTPILIHSVWNSGVIVVLTILLLNGYDIKELLST